MYKVISLQKESLLLVQKLRNANNLKILVEDQVVIYSVKTIFDENPSYLLC